MYAVWAEAATGSKWGDFPNVSAGDYDVRVHVKAFNTRGVFQYAAARSDSSNCTHIRSTQDEYSSAATYPVLNLGTWSPATTSDKSFRFTVTGENATSTGFTICFDHIELIPQ